MDDEALIVVSGMEGKPDLGQVLWSGDITLNYNAEARAIARHTVACSSMQGLRFYCMSAFSSFAWKPSLNTSEKGDLLQCCCCKSHGGSSCSFEGSHGDITVVSVSEAFLPYFRAVLDFLPDLCLQWMPPRSWNSSDTES